jgi:tetratricopeptide (TPR) repeat protein
MLLTACAEFSNQQAPAPVYGSDTPLYGNKPLKPKEPTESASGTAETVKTTPLNAKEIKPEPLPSGQTLLTPEQEKELAALENPPKEHPKPKPVVPEPVIDEIAPPTPVVEAPSPIFQPLEAFSQQSPVVNSLVLAANEDDKKGNDEAATATLERASRIEPRNATLYYKMALLKLKSKPSQAEDLAKKSAQLAANDNNLKKHSWLLVAKARELQKDFDGAKEARAKANKF